MRISVVIIAKNEAGYIEDCLRSVAWANERLVIDDDSTDRTAAMATALEARVLSHKLTGFATQKNFGIDQAKNDWILILDADERVSPELAGEIQALPDQPPAAAYSMPFQNYLGKKWFHHGGFYPDRHLRLFDRRQARYGAREVHETLDINGQTAGLNGSVIHLTYRDSREYLDKVRRYSLRQAEEDFRLQKPEIRLNYAWTVKEFMTRYLVLSGWRDGWIGLVSAVLMGYYRYLYIKRFKQLAK